MPRRSELGWILAMVVVAVTLGFFIGGGPSLLTDRGAEDGPVVAASADTTTSTTAGAGATTTTAVAETTTTMVARAAREVSVRVYNGSTKPGQAVRVGDRLKAEGYQVLTPGPSPGEPLPASVVHFVEGFAAEAEALASSLGLPASAAAPAPSPPIVQGIGPAQLVLIVADDLVLPT